MKFLSLFVITFVLTFSNSYSQTQDELKREAYPTETEVEDQSPASILWRQVVAEKKSGNGNLHSQLVNQYYSNYPERLSSRTAPFDAPKVVNNLPSVPFNGTDWGAGDIRVYLGNVYAVAGNTNAGGNIHNVRLRADSTGNLYTAFINSSRDSLYLFKSVDDGVNWSMLQVFLPGGSNLWHSFDFYVTDTTGYFKIGFAGSVVPNAGSTEGILYFFSIDHNGSNYYGPINVDPPPGGRGYINPSIIADGDVYSAALTYWYIAYQDYSSSTPTNNPVRAALSPDGGGAWTAAVARTSFNDYDVSINYNAYASSDTIRVLLSNNLTLSNPNLRFRRIALSNWPTPWGQFNPASTAAPEYHGSFAVNRQTNQVICTYTIESGGFQNVAYGYGNFEFANFNVTPHFIITQGNNVGKNSIHCSPQDGVYRLTMNSSSAGYDTINYFNSSNLASGFDNRQVVNHTNNATNTSAASVVGFKSGANFESGVAFMESGLVSVWYDGSNVTPLSVSGNGSEIPDRFSLSQNYPNPFNPVTKINFSIPSSGVTKLVVYDIMGREVMTALNGETQAGNYTFEFDGSGLNSGVYFYKLTSNNFSDVKRMILIK